MTTRLLFGEEHAVVVLLQYLYYILNEPRLEDSHVWMIDCFPTFRKNESISQISANRNNTSPSSIKNFLMDKGDHSLTHLLSCLLTYLLTYLQQLQDAETRRVWFSS
jgi:hypothetical protein